MGRKKKCNKFWVGKIPYNDFLLEYIEIYWEVSNYLFLKMKAKTDMLVDMVGTRTRKASNLPITCRGENAELQPTFLLILSIIYPSTSYHMILYITSSFAFRIFYIHLLNSVQ